MTQPPPHDGKVVRTTLIVVLTLLGLFCGLPLLFCGGTAVLGNIFGGHG